MSDTMIHIGADPEFVILDAEGKSIPAHALDIPRKAEKRRVAGGSYLRDGYALELNPNPSYCRGSFNKNLRAMLVDIDGTHGITKQRLTIAARATVKPRKRLLRGAPDDVKRFGCDPSRDAYSGEEKVVTLDARTYPYRHMGGHLHVGSLSNKKYSYKPLVDSTKHDMLAKLADLFVGIPSTVVFNHKREFLRRRVYGQAGEYRSQDYGNGWLGFEYRTPSPEIFNHPALVTLFTGVLRWVVENFDELEGQWRPAIEKELQLAINTGKDVVKLLQTVPSFYTPETILLLRNVEEIRTFQLGTFRHDPETYGWTETAADVWKVPVPA